MEKEYLINKSSVITLNITDGKIDSYRQKDETQATVRAYANGAIGVAGALGDPDMESLEAQEYSSDESVGTSLGDLFKNLKF